MKPSQIVERCPDCGVAIGHNHGPGCAVERCPMCGRQYIGCDHLLTDSDNLLPWTGIWPGVEECREYGFWCKWSDNRGWVPCDADDPDASEDLNQLIMTCTWDQSQRRYVLR